jgi:predicted hotdog family 3-hydroxylacyl-ACP dehydratase
MPPLTREELAGLLPHGGAMRLIDAVESWDESTIRCRTQSHHDPKNPLRQTTCLDVVTGLEYAAQAMGIHVGLHDQMRSRNGVIGYIGGLRDVRFTVERLDDCLSVLFIDATRVFEDDRSFVYRFMISSGGHTVMTGRASLFLKSGQP